MNKRWPKIQQIHRSSGRQSKPPKLCPVRRECVGAPTPSAPEPPVSGPGLHNLAVSQTAKVARAEPHQRRRTVRTRRWTVVFRCAERVHREPRTGLLRRKSGVEVSIAERGSHPARADTEASVEALFADCDARRQHHGQQRPQGRPEGGTAEAPLSNLQFVFCRKLKHHLNKNFHLFKCVINDT